MAVTNYAKPFNPYGTTKRSTEQQPKHVITLKVIRDERGKLKLVKQT
jgi:hypothetical protein